jgi:hypothetical protein
VRVENGRKKTGSETLAEPAGVDACVTHDRVLVVLNPAAYTLCMKLQLEYTCTAEERSEAASLSIRKQLGSGSRWKTWTVLLLLLIACLAMLYFMVHEMAPARYRLHTYIGLLVVITTFVFWKQIARKKGSEPTTKVEIIETEFAIIGADSRIAIPWTGFSDCLESPHLFVLVDRPKATLLIVPKRVFADDDWGNWFRNLANTRPVTAPEVVVSPVTIPATGDGVSLKFRLRLRDYLDRSIASWQTWLGILLMEAFLFGSFLYVSTKPHPNAVYTDAQVFLYFIMPFSLVAGLIGLGMFTLHTWFLHRTFLIPQAILLGEDSMTFSSSDGVHVTPWSVYSNFKETPWSFIAWHPKTRLWMLLPKRDFSSAHDLERCRELLRKHLQPSPWFFH